MSEVQDYSNRMKWTVTDDAPKKIVHVPEANLSMRSEIVHTGQGSLFLDSNDSDGDFSEAVGPNQLRNMEPEIISEGLKKTVFHSPQRYPRKPMRLLITISRIQQPICC